MLPCIVGCRDAEPEPPELAILPGAGAGNGAAGTFCSEPEWEPPKTGRLRLRKRDVRLSRISQHEMKFALYR